MKVKKEILSRNSKTQVQESETQLKRIETELIKASKLAAATAMASGFAHQINNPLFGIQLSTELIEQKIKGNIKELDKAYCLAKLAEIKENIQRIKGLIDHLNNLMKYQSEELTWIDLIEAIRSAHQLFSKQLEKRNIDWIEISEVDRIWVYGNQTKLEQVFINLIANARDALSSTSKPFIKVELTQTEKNVNVKFSDNGSGIPEQYQSQIFQSLFTTKKEGTGLGLWLCNTVIEQMDGKMEFESKDKIGTSFIISLPSKKRSNE